MREQQIPNKIDNQSITSAIGIYSEQITSTITSDIEQMIENDLRLQLKGYVFCLSRYISHKKALSAITQAFNNKSEPVPEEYLKLFKLS